MAMVSEQIEYFDFDIKIGSANDLVYPVNVLGSPAGEASGSMRLSVDDPFLNNCLNRLEEFRYMSLPNNIGSFAHNNPYTTNQNRMKEVEVAKALGHVLFTSLFNSETLASYRSSLVMARNARKKLRLRLRFEDPKLASLPWEFLFDEIENDHISLSRITTILRHLDIGVPSPIIGDIQPPIRILVMAASPSDLSSLDVELERKLMFCSLDNIEPWRIDLRWLDGQTWRDLDKAFQEDTWHIFHFIGHGSFNVDSGEGEIALVDEESGKAKYFSAKQLARLFAFHHSLRLVVINACESARLSNAELLSSTSSFLIQKNVPSVIAMQYPISNRAALEFSRSFYDELLRSQSLESALQRARIAISLALDNSSEWATPVLYSRLIQGRLFPLDTASAVRPTSSTSNWNEDKSFQSKKEKDNTQTKKTEPVDAEHTTRLKELANVVRKARVEKKLGSSLFDSILIDIGVRKSPPDVDNRWSDGQADLFLESIIGSSHPTIPISNILNLFDEVGRSLLVLGEPGSGKTTTILELARTMLLSANDDTTKIVPVIFDLSDWNSTYISIHDWIVDQMSIKYCIPKDTSRKWLSASQILPFLDGLDELNLDLRIACVKAINSFLIESAPVGAVVSCRLKEYMMLPNDLKLKLNAAVKLLPLVDEQITQFLNRAGARLAGLKLAMEKNTALLMDARVPIKLMWMCSVFQDVPASEISSAHDATSSDRLNRLIKLYIEKQFKMAGKKAEPVNENIAIAQSYSEEETKQWLNWLAKGMLKHGHTVFMLEQIQPSWLMEQAQLNLYILVTRIIWGIIGSALFWQLGEFDDALEIGVICGISFGLIDLIRYSSSYISTGSKVSTLRNYILCILLAGIIIAIMPLESGFEIVLLRSIIGGVVFGSIWASRSYQRDLHNEIQTVEQLSWSWEKAYRGGIVGCVAGIAVALPIAIIIILSNGVDAEAIGGVIGGLLVMTFGSSSENRTQRTIIGALAGGIIGGVFEELSSAFLFLVGLGIAGCLIGSLIGGIKTRQIQSDFVPNQRMQLTSHSGTFLGIGVWLIIVLVAPIMGSDMGFVYGFLSGLCVFLWYGGLDLIQHRILRLILYYEGYTPRDYVSFLDYTVSELSFMQKVGGGYSFSHRYLLEYFASNP